MFHLLFYAQCLYNSLEDELLFDDEISRSPHGPIITSLESEIKENGIDSFLQEEYEEVDPQKSSFVRLVQNVLMDVSLTTLKKEVQNNEAWKIYQTRDSRDFIVTKECFPTTDFEKKMKRDLGNKLAKKKELQKKIEEEMKGVLANKANA